MSFSIGDYEFQGLFNTMEKIKNNAGVFAVICGESNEYIVIDIGEADDVKKEIEFKSKQNTWKEFCKAKLFFACHYTNNKDIKDRKKIEDEIRQEYLPLLGTK